jgi:hypothetical protein
MSTFNWAEAASGHISSVVLTTTIALSALHLRDDTAFMFGSSPRNVDNQRPPKLVRCI